MSHLKLDVDAIMQGLDIPNDRADLVNTTGLSITDADVPNVDLDNTKWLDRMDKHRDQLQDQQAVAMAGELASAKRRTLQWLQALGYHGVLAIWRKDTLGLLGVQKQIEERTHEPIDPTLILDFMESHDQWPIDLDAIFRTHALLHEGNWQTMSAGADEFNMVDVAKAKQMSTLAFERAGTLNRDRFAKVMPRDEGATGNVIQIVINKDGHNTVGVDKQQVAYRQQLTAKARVRYGTGQYVDPPGLREWQQGVLPIPDDKVDDYLMLQWVPDNLGVIPEAIAQTVDVADESFSSVVDDDGDKNVVVYRHDHSIELPEP